MNKEKTMDVVESYALLATVLHETSSPNVQQQQQ